MDIQPYSCSEYCQNPHKILRTLLTYTGFIDPNESEACLSQFIVENELFLLVFLSTNQRLRFRPLYLQQRFGYVSL